MSPDETRAEVGVGLVRVVQFLHPGHEYDATRAGFRTGDEVALMPWKPGNSRHDRKYLQAVGAVTDLAGNSVVDGVEIGFWGEWEPPSRVTRTGNPYQNWGLPSLVHQPIWPAIAPASPRQNTDPLVFGDAFRYTNCQQDKSVMQQLAPGSVILFGRASHRRAEFRMDTCLVVDGAEVVSASSANPPSYGEDLVTDVVTDALLSEAEGRPIATTHYRGATPNPLDESAPFSFFPAVVAAEHPKGFVRALIRPQGSLRDLINPRHQQGILTTQCDRAKASAVWQEVVAQVVDQGLMLGTRAHPYRDAAE